MKVSWTMIHLHDPIGDDNSNHSNQSSESSGDPRNGGKTPTHEDNDLNNNHPP